MKTNTAIVIERIPAAGKSGTSPATTVAGLVTLVSVEDAVGRNKGLVSGSTGVVCREK